MSTHKDNVAAVIAKMHEDLDRALDDQPDMSPNVALGAKIGGQIRALRLAVEGLANIVANLDPDHGVDDGGPIGLAPAAR